ncbi:hypothetical protein [Gordonia sp. NPDC003585]|uniref:hypothetical protein n=1 Tax=Gordonia sp. NPDC003585 TaxID=3154275 RepID=UPI0033AF4EA8
MSGDLFGWDEEAAASAATRVASAGAALQADIVALNGRIQHKAGWVGPEHELFEDVYDAWQKAATVVEDILEVTSKLVGGANTAVGSYRDGIREALNG